jgi:hypothetical protein
MLPKVINIQIKVESNPNINIELDTEVSPNDHVLGKITPRQKELLITASQLQVIVVNSSEIANGTDANGMKNILKAKVNELSEKSSTIMKAFIIDIADSYNLWPMYNEIDIGVRKGWMVVWTEAIKEENIPYEIGISNN